MWRALRIIVAIACLMAESSTLAQKPAGKTPTPPVDQRAGRQEQRSRSRQEIRQLRGNRQFAQALELAKQSASIEEKLLPPDNKELYRAWELVAYCAEDIDDWSTAHSALEQAKQIARSVFGKDNWRTADCRRAEEYLTLLEKLSPEDCAAVHQATQLAIQAMQFQHDGKLIEAASLARQVFDIRQRVLGPDHPDTAWILSVRSMICQQQGNFAEAESLGLRGLKAHKKTLGPEHYEVADSLNDLGILYRAQGQYAQAEKAGLRALQILEKVHGTDHPDVAIALRSLGSLYQYQGQLAKAVDFDQRALKIQEQNPGPEDPDTATTLAELASAYQSQGNYAKAQPLYQRALAIYEKTLGPEHPYLGVLVNNFAATFDSQGNYAAAEPLYRRALAIAEKVQGPEHPFTASALNNLACMFQMQQDYAAAEPLYARALKIREKVLGPDHPHTAITLSNLAAVYDSQKKYAEAEPLYQRALKISEKTAGPDHPHTATIVNNLGYLNQNLGKYAAAEKFYQRALDINQRVFGPDHPTTADALRNLAFLHWLVGRSLPARQLAARALDIRLKHMEQTASIQTEQQQFLMAEEAASHLNVLLTVTADDPTRAGEVWERVLAWKGLATTRQAVLRQALKDDPTYAEFRQISQQLSTVSLNPPRPPADPQELAAWNRQSPQLRRDWQQQKATLENEYQRLETELSPKSAAFQHDHERRKVTLETVVASLQQSAQPTALVDLIDYWHDGAKGKKGVSARHVAAFVIRSDGQIRRLELGPSQPIDAELSAWRQTYGLARRMHDAGRELRRLLWAPLEPALDGIRTVLVSPDGQIAELPWGALPGAKPATYLVEERSIAVIPVPQMLPGLVREKLLGGPPASLLLVGDIDYGGDPGTAEGLLAQHRSAIRQRSGSWQQFSKLDNAQSELSSIRDWYEQAGTEGTVKTLRRRLGTEAAFRQQAPRHAWVHLITHGYFAGSDLNRRLAESTQPELSSSEKASAAESSVKPTAINPGLLSGLAFAGANTPPEPDKDDGILTALEVSALDLSQVDTVVLSACETGLGKVAGGEGLLGLQRSFQVAGAKTVVASLWKVPDAATSKLMQRFYENLWDKKLGKLDALREAQIWMLRDKGNRGLTIDKDQPADETSLPPYYWAAFVLSGDWR